MICHILNFSKAAAAASYFKASLATASSHWFALVHRAPLNSFVGLKNGGATCYMNSVFQQLFMQPFIRKMLLAVPESSDDQTDNVFYQMQVICLF